MDIDNLRNNGRIDIDVGIRDGLVIKDEIESVGARNKFWFNNYKFLYKEIFEDSYEDFAEIISSEIALELGMRSAEYDLASYDGKNGVITKNFVLDDAGEELISGTEIINEVYQKHIFPLQEMCKKYFELLEGYDVSKDFSNITTIDVNRKRDLLKEIHILVKDFGIKFDELLNLNYDKLDLLTDEYLNSILDKCCQVFLDFKGMYVDNIMEVKNGVFVVNNLFDLWSFVDNYCRLNGFNNNSDQLIKEMSNLFIYDIITSQGDRHSDNWGVILNRNTKEVRLAPIYDNSNMCNLNRTKAVKAIYDKINTLESNKGLGPKASRIEDRLKKEIYHSRSLLGVNTENGLEKDKNVEMMKQFVSVSSNEVIDELVYKLQCLDFEKLNDIYLRVEGRIGIEIPQNVKAIISKTIGINRKEFFNILESREVRVNGK